MKVLKKENKYTQITPKAVIVKSSASDFARYTFPYVPVPKPIIPSTHQEMIPKTEKNCPIVL